MIARVRGADGAGCTFLGNIYADGTGVQPDIKAAVKNCMMGCDLGDGMGCNNVGVAPPRTGGTEKNYTLALAYYDLSCTKGYDEVCTAAAQLIRDGRVKRDPAAIRQYEDKAQALRGPPAP